MVAVGFNTQPPEGGWLRYPQRRRFMGVSTHSRLKAAGKQMQETFRRFTVSTHSRLKAAGLLGLGVSLVSYVSTHSRLKAAGLALR